MAAGRTYHGRHLDALARRAGRHIHTGNGRSGLCPDALSAVAGDGISEQSGIGHPQRDIQQQEREVVETDNILDPRSARSDVQRAPSAGRLAADNARQHGDRRSVAGRRPGVCPCNPRRQICGHDTRQHLPRQTDGRILRRQRDRNVSRHHLQQHRSSPAHICHGHLYQYRHRMDAAVQRHHAGVFRDALLAARPSWRVGAVGVPARHT